MVQILFNVDIAQAIASHARFGYIKTRDGHLVTILHWDARGTYPLIGLVDTGLAQIPMAWTREGKTDARDNVRFNNDLILEVEGGEA